LYYRHPDPILVVCRTPLLPQDGDDG
jgi:hypothetical protein